MSAITEAEDYFSDYGSEYEHADSYRKAARWLVFVAVLGSFFHFLMIFFRYLYINSSLKLLFNLYSYLVSITHIRNGIAMHCMINMAI